MLKVLSHALARGQRSAKGKAIHYKKYRPLVAAPPPQSQRVPLPMVVVDEVRATDRYRVDIQEVSLLTEAT